MFFYLGLLPICHGAIGLRFSTVLARSGTVWIQWNFCGTLHRSGSQAFHRSESTCDSEKSQVDSDRWNACDSDLCRVPRKFHWIQTVPDRARTVENAIRMLHGKSGVARDKKHVIILFLSTDPYHFLLRTRTSSNGENVLQNTVSIDPT